MWTVLIVFCAMAGLTSSPRAKWVLVMRAIIIQKPRNSICHIWKPFKIFGTEGVHYCLENDTEIFYFSHKVRIIPWRWKRPLTHEYRKYIYKYLCFLLLCFIFFLSIKIKWGIISSYLLYSIVESKSNEIH